MREGEGVGRIAFDDGTVARRSRGHGGADAVEAQIDPGREEAEPREEHGRLGTKNQTRYSVGEEEDGGEMFHAHANEALCDSDGMLRHELLEGDEKASLDRYAT